MKKLFKLLGVFSFALIMSLTIVLAGSVSKTKTGKVNCGNYGTLSVKDTATRNTTTGDWSVKHAITSSSDLNSSYRASTSNGGSITKTNDGLTLTHNAYFSVYYKANSTYVGSYYKTFVFEYNINTKVIN